jgi:hypothetical protein
MKTRKDFRREGGALALAMVVVAMAGVLGAALMGLGTASSVEAAKEVSWSQAFWSAEAGLEHARAIAHKRRLAGAAQIFPLTEPRSWTGATARGRYEVSVQEIAFSPPSYRVTSEGYSQGGARAAVEATFAQTNALSVGLFGADSLGMQPNQTITSDPPGAASLGSNGQIDLQNNVLIDGAVYIGADTNGQPASVDTNRYNTYDYVSTGYVDPDPLGAVGGALALEFSAAAAANNNAACAFIRNGALNVRQNQSCSLPGGVYYLSGVDIDGDLVMTNGPVRIYLTGGMTVSGPKSTLNVAGAPSDFRIYSNSSADIVMTPNSIFRGLIYAPYADVTVQPNNLIDGVVWGRNVALQPQNNATVMIDTELLSYGAFNNIYRVAVSWRQLPRSW